ncbi:MAG TPA: hypothetical protein VF939_21920 [Puia sp.]
MKNVRLLLSLLLILSGYVASSQDSSFTKHAEPRLIAVVNRATWCRVCKANGERAGALLMSYTDKGLRIFMNDLTDSISIEASKAALRKENLYAAVYTSPRKGMGRMMQHCGLLKGKAQPSMATGIVTFINPVSHQRLQQVSIAVSNEEMKADIETMLK